MDSSWQTIADDERRRAATQGRQDMPSSGGEEWGDEAEALFFPTDPERDLLWALLADPERVRGDIAGLVEADHFTLPMHQRCYKLLTHPKAPADATELIMLAHRRGAADVRSYLVDLLGWDPPCGRPQVHMAAYHARSIRRAWVDRQLDVLAVKRRQVLRGQMVELPGGVRVWPTMGQEQIAALFAEAESSLALSTADEWHSIAEAAGLALDEAEKAQHALEQGGAAALRTGIEGLDDMLDSGVRRGQLCVLAGRPGAGKTAFALHLIDQWAGVLGAPGAIVSLEMQRSELAARMLSALTGVSGSALRTGNLRTDEWEILEEHKRLLREWPIAICDTPGLSASQIEAAVRPLAMRGKLQWLAVDYLTLMGEEPGRKKWEAVGANCTALKNLAKKHQIPVLLLAQLNRDVEKRPDPTPRMSDLRDSGQIEQDADIIMFIDRPDRNAPETVLHLAKQRAGRTGSVAMSFDAAHMRFGDLGSLL